MTELKLANCVKTSIIDNEDLESILAVSSKWYLSSRGYVQANGLNGTIMLHRFITKCPSNMVVDHINRDKLDNRKINLEKVSHRINITRQPKRYSKYGIKAKGVIKMQHKEKVYFYARIKFNGKMISAGKHFNNEHEAEIAAKELYSKYCGGVK